MSAGAASDELVLAIVEALRGYISERAQAGLSVSALAQRWYDEQLFPPDRTAFASALRLMDKTQRGHERVPRRRQDSMR